MTPESLTATLRGSHGLLNGAVERVVLEPRETIGLGAEFCIAHVTYSQVEDLPDRFFVKRSKISDRGQSEVDFYELAAREATGLPLPRFFGAVDERADEPLNMLFEDYSESHTQTPWPLVPTLECCRAAVAALAANSPQLVGPDRRPLPLRHSLRVSIKRGNLASTFRTLRIFLGRRSPAPNGCCMNGCWPISMG